MQTSAGIIPVGIAVGALVSLAPSRIARLRMSQRIACGLRVHQRAADVDPTQRVADDLRQGPYASGDALDDEFRMRVMQNGVQIAAINDHHYNPEHEHDDDVTSIGLEFPGDFDQEKLNGWLGDLLMNQGPDIFRMKGIIAIKGEEKRFVFQGVHMLFDGRPDRPWHDTPRSSQMVFIGRNLDREQLTSGFPACLAS